MKKTVLMLVTIALCGMACVPKAKAQDLGGALDLPMLGQGLTLSAAIRAQAQRDAARMSGGLTSASKKKTATKLQGSTRFQVSFAQRRRNLAQFVAKIRQASPRDAAVLQQSFAQRDPIATIAPGLRRFNLRTDDVADTATAYLVSAWYGVRGRNDDPPVSYVNGVRNQMRRVMLSVPAFVSASNATKQQMAEALLIQTMVTDALVSKAKGNPAQMTKVKAIIGQGVRNSFRLNLGQLKLTNQGLHA